MRQFEAHGAKWNWDVDDAGQFTARLSGGVTVVYGQTLADVREKASVISRKRKAQVAVPFTLVRGDGSTANGTVYALHAGSGNKMVQWHDGNKEQFSPHWSQDTVFPPLTDEEREEATRLKRAVRDAEAAWGRFHGAHRKPGWDLDSEVNKALEAAQSPE